MFGRPDLTDMVVVKVVFFAGLYLLVMFLEKRGEDLCEVAGMGMAVTWVNGLVIVG